MGDQEVPANLGSIFSACVEFVKVTEWLHIAKNGRL